MNTSASVVQSILQPGYQSFEVVYALFQSIRSRRGSYEKANQVSRGFSQSSKKQELVRLLANHAEVIVWGLFSRFAHAVGYATRKQLRLSKT